VLAGLTLPQATAEQVTLQVTPLLAESLATVAVICSVPPACTVLALDVTLTVIAGGPPALLQPETNPATTRVTSSSLFMDYPPWPTAHSCQDS
jgi:hypothetical protein